MEVVRIRFLPKMVHGSNCSNGQRSIVFVLCPGKVYKAQQELLNTLFSRFNSVAFNQDPGQSHMHFVRKVRRSEFTAANLPFQLVISKCKMLFHFRVLPAHSSLVKLIYMASIIYRPMKW